MRRLFDILAICVLLGYAWLATRSQGGADDPVWQRAKARGVLVVGTDFGFLPFAQLEGQQPIGYDVELVEEIARRLDLTVEWRQIGYDGLFPAIDPANPNQVDLIAAGIIQNPAEGWRARYSQAYLDGGQQLLVSSSNPITKQNQLIGSISVQLGSPGESIARQIFSPQQIDNSPYIEIAAADLVVRGFSEAAIVGNLTALHTNNRQQTRTLASLSYEPFVLAMPITAYELQNQINRELGQLHAEGWIAKLNQKWFP
ncbi:MAG TPA: amino acid ABC transporter substrate-binding protein [Herpetosiphon sp.]|uniref:Extracellular solute-binding protein family 3 n=1 Tax=Herpetosiphon aurantiacus (strain ATCC 23779 / DSM 785 / 114-95) TaxID=316274 RepID=A9B627_HERA2|nr:ABC transporter substrate-binding protein [Herpetosiphon sp.]ABX05820.1 extracellular solute-binding protein family 3 [Herpetosiphon aurantiacus DSM 785]HBW48747.1 amino acid ABC transporter substrate-binding protein [Herpetosiphon sp.]